jgi:hypothetical protein
MKLGRFTLAFALLAAACLPAVAQSRMSLNIPFAFTVNSKTLPAGHYDVWRTSTISGENWAIAGEHSDTILVNTYSVQSPGHEHAFSVVFLRAGDQFLLNQIWNGTHAGHELQVPQAMKPLVIAEGNGKQYVEIAGK